MGIEGSANTDFEAITEAFDRTQVRYREASPEEAADLAARFGVVEAAHQGKFDGSPRALLLANNEGRSPGPAMLFDRDGNYVGLGDDRRNATFVVEFYGRAD